MARKFFIFGSNRRPLVGSENTGRDAYMRPFSVASVSLAGMGGANNYRSLSPFNATTFNLASLRPASVSGQGNANVVNPLLRPLINKAPDTPTGNIGVGPSSFPNQPRGGQF